MQKTYVIAAHRLSESGAAGELHADLYFVAEPSIHDRRDLPPNAAAVLSGLDTRLLRKWKHRQAAHQWLSRNESRICHEQRFSFRTVALQFEVMTLPLWLVSESHEGAPKKIPGLRGGASR